MRRVIGFGLVLEALWTAIDLAQLLPVILSHSASVITIVALRATVAVAELVSYSGLNARRAGAERLAAITLLASALLRTFEIGLRMSPSDLTPGLRTPVIVGYWVYAMGASAYLCKRT